jgi:hypothetical protein
MTTQPDAPDGGLLSIDPDGRDFHTVHQASFDPTFCAALRSYSLGTARGDDLSREVLCGAVHALQANGFRVVRG